MDAEGDDLCSRDGGRGGGDSRPWPHQHSNSSEECPDGPVPSPASGWYCQYFAAGTLYAGGVKGVGLQDA